MTTRRADILALALLLAGCDRLRRAIEPDPPDAKVEEKKEERESEEERENREHFWRVELTLVGQGVVRTNLEGIKAIWVECTRDEKGQSGECGPKLLRWREGQPPLLTARGAKGWKFVRWESKTRKSDGKIVPTAKKFEPAQRLYFNAMGVDDNGDSELLTAYFEKQNDPAFEDVDPK